MYFDTSKERICSLTHKVQMSSIFDMESTTESRRKRRSNAEILADSKLERAALKAKPKRKRRTNAEMERDRRKEADAKLKAELANPPTYKVVLFHAETNAFGKLWSANERVELTPDSYYYGLAFDKFGNFILNKSFEEQISLWGYVKYEVSDKVL